MYVERIFYLIWDSFVYILHISFRRFVGFWKTVSNLIFILYSYCTRNVFVSFMLCLSCALYIKLRDWLIWQKKTNIWEWKCDILGIESLCDRFKHINNSNLMCLMSSIVLYRTTNQISTESVMYNFSRLSRISHVNQNVQEISASDYFSFKSINA